MAAMMDVNLTIDKILDRAIDLYPHKEIATAGPEGIRHRYTYADAYDRICQLAHGLDELGIQEGERIATFAPNNYRHYELYFGPSCSGRSIHMVNHRLPDEHITHLLNDAKDRVVFVDPDFINKIEHLTGDFETVEQYIVLDDEVPADTTLDPVMSYEDLLSGHSTEYNWPDIDQETECGICYTSGTTGKPKGVSYTHRAVYLHSLMMGHVDTHSVSEHDNILIVVPMFHANGWGLPYGGTFVGSKQVLPNQHNDPEAIARTIDSEQVTYAAAVPTLWIDIKEYLDQGGDYDISSIDRLVVGGSAPPESLIRHYEEEFDAPILQGWGMTEMTPIGTVSTLTTEAEELSPMEQYSLRAKGGIPVPGVELRIRDDNGEPVPRDGETFGELQARGPWVIDEYHNRPDATEESFTSDGWLKTGDLATRDEYGYVDIVDRVDDVIKSGGEWISSVELENELMAHEAIKEAAVVGVPHEKWQERPFACVSTAGSNKVSQDELREHLLDRFPTWWLPDKIKFVENLPKTSTGKFDKIKIQDELADREELNTPER